MLQKFIQHINTNFPFLKDVKLLLAISGGLDSVVLMHLCNQLNLQISLAHCNFKLRNEESDLDEEFVKKIGQISSNQIFTTYFETEKIAKNKQISIQIAARELRYNWFQELVLEHQFEFVLTAHHLDDSLETFLIHLTRGSGLDGFTGIPAKSGNIIRPLLAFSRAEILEYAIENQLEWREDSSNATTKYLRNNIRHQVIPILKEINPSLLDSFANTIQNLQDAQQIIDDKIEEISANSSFEKDGMVFFDVSKIKQLSKPKAYLYQLLKKYQFTEWNNVLDLLTSQTGKQVFSKTHVLLKDRDFLILSEIPIKKKDSAYVEILETQSTISTPIFLNFEENPSKKIASKNSISVAKNLLKYPLILRKWQNGDYFCPSGMQGKKKLSKYFKDEKISLIEKEKIWLLCTAENEIIWVINHRQDRRFLANSASENSLQIIYKS
ncbi:tRNA lysidine(34) synthetase TilS [Polaribacter gangjinensis]|uniref:tRNA(Ile)-lysidine synthase n=1 Tax=Polaribacter gangjinensis TaxID=574710 RepID=A0A2S7WDM7_9FLAO|nr:tRNA lysidine(34) synthetase TilS [Polaribacter gangjinensis]PQJ75687.1 tRNA lysidine(34) synthetase TilS [Polaribacter gangjinensis]